MLRVLRWIVAGSSPLARGLPARYRREVAAGGSSPLARGLPALKSLEIDRAWIIPARAGFTGRTPSTRRAVPDHPRSRGVYLEPAQRKTVV